MIILIVLFAVLIIDTVQAKIFNNRPLFKVVEDYNGGNLAQKDSGVLVYTYVYADGTKKTVFRWEKYAPVEEISVDLENKTETSMKNDEKLEKLKKLFEENSIVKVYIKDTASINDTDTLYNKIEQMPYFKDVDLVTSLDAYQKMIDQYGEDSELVKSIDKYSLQESIWAQCYYLDDISLLDEDSYFEKIKTDIHKIDENDIIENIVTAGIIDIYNSGGMEAVNEYIEKGK